MTSIAPKIPINPNLYYPVVLKWANGRIREMKGSYLLDTENPESWRYIQSNRASFETCDKYPHLGMKG